MRRLSELESPGSSIERTCMEKAVGVLVSSRGHDLSSLMYYLGNCITNYKIKDPGKVE